MEMHELLPSRVPLPLKFQSVTLENLEKSFGVGDFAIGDIVKGEDLAWLSRGASLEVININTAQRVGAWSFGIITKESNTTITSVVEFRYNWETILLVGLQSRGAGMLCIFNPFISKIFSAIELPSKVVSLEVIPNQKEIVINYLRSFSGLVAVGMDSGLVYLVDLCLDRSVLSNETQPAKLNVIPASTPDIIQLRESLDDGEHLAIILDADCCQRGSYHYRAPNGKIVQSFSASEVFVTAMKFIPQIGSLLVGMNFGCFQVWTLDGLMLEYTSPYESDLAPITHFIYQEPENDPKKYVYVWIGRGPTFVDGRDGDRSALSLYQFSYDKKFAAAHEVLYKSLQFVVHRFEHPLTGDPYNLNSESDVSGSSLISCEVITDAAYQRKREDEPSVNDLSLCAFLWDVRSDNSSKPTYLLGLFDLNRWYHAQMPASLKPSYLKHGVCPFFAFYNLEDIVEIANPECILAARICKESVTRYRSTITPAPEQHIYPSALAFDICCLLEQSVIRLQFSGIQKQILSEIRRNNPMALVEPTTLFKNCSSAEILPKFSDASVRSSLAEQRENLLTVCVENAMVDVILSCINMWADGEYARSGCTLRVLLSAAWSRVVKAKEVIDKTCVPLFDCSATGVDRQTIGLLHQQETELGRLCRVFQQLLNLSATTTEQGVRDLQVKLNVTTLLHDYMRVLTWLVVIGLLPETLEGDDTSSKYNYPATSLSQAFNDRRQELNRLHMDVTFGNLLMIDGLIDEISNEIKDLWNKEGGNGLYPPPSLHAVLGMYLLEGVPLNAKHCVVAYLLLDVISLLPDNPKLVQDCTLFSQCFGLTASLARLVQGFWLLDHRDYEEALYVLLDPHIANSDFSPWQHTRIIKALLYQGQAKSALKYMNVRHRNVETAEDVKLKLTVLLASGHTNQAFEYQRLYRSRYNREDMLIHFFTGCQQTRKLGQLLSLPLDDFEDSMLVDYLTNGTHGECQELLVMYYLQRSRYVDAIRLHEELKKSVVVDVNPVVLRRAEAREAIINGHLSNLPEVQRALIAPQKLTVESVKTTRVEVERPQPLSTLVHSGAHQIQSQASLICAVMEKVKEVQKLDAEDNEPTIEAFIGVPTTPKTKQKIQSNSDMTSPEKSLIDIIQHTPVPSSHKESPLSAFISNSARKRMQKYQNAEAMSLLATPPVRRAKTSRIKPAQATPQSILKVRQTVASSPLVKLNRPPVSSSEVGSPAIRKNPFVSLSASPLALKPGTPKLLRFVLSPSRSNTQLNKPVATTPPAVDLSFSSERLDESAMLSQVVDEEITFNFKDLPVIRAQDDKMDTDNNSCPSTPSAIDDHGTPESSPPKLQFPSSVTPEPLHEQRSSSSSRICDQSMEMRSMESGDHIYNSNTNNSDRQAISLVIRPERMEADESFTQSDTETTGKSSQDGQSGSPYQKAIELLTVVRTEYEAREQSDDTCHKHKEAYVQESQGVVKNIESKEDVADVHKLGQEDNEENQEEVYDEESHEEIENMKRSEKEKINEEEYVVLNEPQTADSKDEYIDTDDESEELVEMSDDVVIEEREEIVDTSPRFSKIKQFSKTGSDQTATPRRISDAKVTSPKVDFPSPVEIIMKDSPSHTSVLHEAKGKTPIRLHGVVKPRSTAKKSIKKISFPLKNTPSPERKKSPRKINLSPERISPEKEILISPRRSPRFVRKARTPTPERERPRQKSPLSSDAFMMKLRHSPRGSRDVTPEQSSHDDEPIRFTFSHPVSLSADNRAGSSTPVPQPFIFSPPVTRSRRKRDDGRKSMRSNLLDPNPSMCLDTSGLSDLGLDDSSILNTSKTTGAKKSRRKITIDTSIDSPINFISPVQTKESTTIDEKTGLPSKMTLRSRFRVSRPERKSVKLMKK